MHFSRRPSRASGWGSLSRFAPSARLSLGVGRLGSLERFEMLTKPIGQVGGTDLASGQIEHEALLIIDRGIHLGTVEDQKGFHGGMPQALVAIDERVALNQREAQRRSLLSQRRIQVDVAEGRIRRGAGTTPCSSAVLARQPS